MEGFGKKSYNKIWQSIENSKKVKLSNLLVALGIPQVGVGGAKRLAKHFKNIGNIIDATVYELISVEDFGESIIKGQSNGGKTGV